MMQRYVLPQQAAAEHEFVPEQAWWRFEARYNVAPLQFVPCLRMHDSHLEASMMAWGLLPAAAESPDAARRPALVDFGELEVTPGIREAWHQSRRCILPAAGFYAWRSMPAGHRQPYFVRLADRMVFGIAGLWDRWSDEDGEVIESCCAISVPSNDFLRAIFPGEARMPAILHRRDYAAWLNGNQAEARGALRPYGCEGMETCAVSPRINSPRAEGRGLIQPVRIAAG